MLKTDFFKFASLNKQDFSDNRNIGLFFKSVQLAFLSILYKQIKTDLSYLVLIRQREVRKLFLLHWRLNIQFLTGRASPMVVQIRLRRWLQTVAVILTCDIVHRETKLFSLGNNFQNLRVALSCCHRSSQSYFKLQLNVVTAGVRPL